MARRSNDYIPTAAENIAKMEAYKKYMHDHPDVRSTYKVKYTLFGKEYCEEVFDITAEKAIATIKNEYSLVGYYPYNFSAEKIKN